ELTCKDQALLFTGHSGRFEEDDFATNGCPDHAGCDAGAVDPFGDFFEEALTAQIFGDLNCADVDGSFATFGDLACHFATECTDLPFQIAYTCFTCIIACNTFERVILDCEFSVFQAI